MRVIMAVSNYSPAVVSRRAKHLDDFRVPTFLGAPPRPTHFNEVPAQIRVIFNEFLAY